MGQAHGGLPRQQRPQPLLNKRRLRHAWVRLDHLRQKCLVHVHGHTNGMHVFIVQVCIVSLKEDDGRGTSVADLHTVDGDPAFSLEPAAWFRLYSFGLTPPFSPSPTEKRRAFSKRRN